MKRKILTSIICAAIAIATLQASEGTRMEIGLSKASGLDMANSLAFKADVGEALFLLKLTQEKGHGIVAKAPPFSLNLSDVLLVGELSAKGLLSLMLDPFNGPFPYKGFEKNGNIEIPGNLSLRPKLSGMALCAENLDIVALNPVFNPASPQGFGMVMGNANSFVSFLVASQNSSLVLKANPKLQVNWKHLGYGRHMLLSMVGTSFKGNVSSLHVEGALFVQNAWDLFLGGGTSTGIGIKLGFCGMEVELEHRLGGVGVKLKDLDGNCNPIEDLFLSCKFGRSFILGCSYSATNFAPPLYGGHSQERLVEYGSSLSYGGFSISCTNHVHFEEDKGKDVYSLLEAGYHWEDEHSSSKLKLSMRLNRPKDKPIETTEASFSLSCPNAQLQLKGSKVWLKYGLDVPVGVSHSLGMTIDQDRRVSLKLSYEQ